MTLISGLLRHYSWVHRFCSVPLAWATVMSLAAVSEASGEDGSAGETKKSVFYAADGPWGRLRCTDIHLEAPQNMVSRFEVPAPVPRWSFPSEQFDELARFFRNAGVREALISKLLGLERVVKEGGYVHLFPPIMELESMAPETRLIVYTKLSNYRINIFHADPVLIVGESVEEFFASSDLRPELIRKISQLSYRRGGTIAFSDASVLVHYCRDDAEVQRVMKAMTRTKSLMIRVEVDEDSNIDELVDYWTLGDGARKKDIEPIIRSIIETHGLETLPLPQLLPPLARKLIYTFPGIELARHGSFPDCHWTSLNFLNYEAHEHLLDADLAAKKVVHGCEKVEPPFQYGDILMFVNEGTGRAIHSCVHLADEIVYTKNGRNILSPWILMRLTDVEKIYRYRGDVSIQGYRRFPE